MFAVASAVQTAFMFTVVFLTRVSTAVVSLILPDVWTATVSTFPLGNLTKVSTAVQSYVFVQVVV